MYSKAPILIFILCSINIYAAQKENSVFQEYSARSSEETMTVIENELASKDRSARDKAIMSLAGLIQRHEAALMLADNREIVNIASDIVAEHVAGWYEERESTERSMPFYYPLIHLLSISKSKIAGMTLSMALPMVGFDPFFRKSAFTNELVKKSVGYKLATIENQLCCLYPGKELVSDMQAIDLRLTILRMYLEAAENKDSAFAINDTEMKKFISSCLEFGDENKGRIIRTNAVELACVCIKAGQSDFLPAVKKIAESDPSCLYSARPAESKSLPLYNYVGKYYPVREKAAKELLQLYK
jgi:hypothetical protein